MCVVDSDGESDGVPLWESVTDCDGVVEPEFVRVWDWLRVADRDWEGDIVGDDERESDELCVSLGEAELLCDPEFVCD